MNARSILTTLFGLGVALTGGRAFAACGLSQIAELPVTMSMSRPLVAAKINGVDAAFIADSGAFFSLITPATAAERGLKLGVAPWGLSMVGIGGRVQQLSLVDLQSFTLAGVTFPHSTFLVGGSEVGADAAGLLGQNILGLADVEYDLANGVIRLMRPKDCGSDGVLAYWAQTTPYSVLNIRSATRQAPNTIGAAVLNGVKIRVMFDTGAAVSFLSLAAAERAGVKPGGPGVVKSGFSSGLGRSVVQTWIAPFQSFEIGDEQIRNTRLRIGDIGLPDVDMLIGADFFLSHRVYVANSQHKLYFSYNGGPVFNLTSTVAAPAGPSGASASTKDVAASEEAQATPVDAAGFSGRGQAFAARRDFTHALADLNRACELAPTEARYFYQRGLVQLANKLPLMALLDFSQALKLKPDDVPALMIRAEIRLAAQDKANAITDLDAADHAAPKEADIRLRLAVDYERADLLPRALTQFDTWIRAHPEDSKQAQALNGRCWTRAQLGRELDKALSDCDTALRMSPKNADILGSRGLVRLRQGDLDKALADYDAALVLQPKNPWGLYGRGVVKAKKGLAAEGRADIAAAKALQPLLPEEARTRGITP